LGGGISNIIIDGLNEAKERGLKVFGIVGRDGGFTYEIGDCVVLIPTLTPHHVTPHAEAFQGMIWHSLVSHPMLQLNKTKW